MIRRAITTSLFGKDELFIFDNRLIDGVRLHLQCREVGFGGANSWRREWGIRLKRVHLRFQYLPSSRCHRPWLGHFQTVSWPMSRSHHSLTYLWKPVRFSSSRRSSAAHGCPKFLERKQWPLMWWWSFGGDRWWRSLVAISADWHSGEIHLVNDSPTFVQSVVFVDCGRQAVDNRAVAWVQP